jgi:hypothetical protein
MGFKSGTKNDNWNNKINYKIVRGSNKSIFPNKHHDY